MDEILFISCEERRESVTGSTLQLTVRVRVPSAAQVPADLCLGQVRVQVQQEEGRGGHGHVEGLQFAQRGKGDRFQETVAVTGERRGLRLEDIILQ